MLRNFRDHFLQCSGVRFLFSNKVTVACLVLLFILTFWGTIDQVSSGLYLAQEKFFHSWFFTLGGFIPFPGARLVMWVLALNLIGVALTGFTYRWSNLGNTMTHGGLLLFFVAAFVTFHGTRESGISLLEGDGTNMSLTYHDWELSLWQEKDGKQHVVAIDTARFKKGRALDFGEYGLSVVIKEYYPNAEAFLAPAPETEPQPKAAEILNASGINKLQGAALEKEPEKNIPGGIFLVHGAGQPDVPVLLFGGEEKPARILPAPGSPDGLRLALRRKRLPLPFVLKLKDFTMERHPNTSMARSYTSLVEVVTPEASREVLISMNNPLRYNDFTIYQSSYAIREDGREESTLAVVKNSGRLLPYVASGVTFAGLALQLLMTAFGPDRKKSGKSRDG